MPRASSRKHRRNRSHVPQQTPIKNILIYDHPVKDTEIQKQLGHSRAVKLHKEFGNHLKYQVSEVPMPTSKQQDY